MHDLSVFDGLLSTLSTSWQPLPDKPEEQPESTLCALAFAAAGQPRSIERALWSELPALSGEQWHTLAELVSRRSAGVPLAHLTGRQQFMEIEMLAGPEGLIPRKETEILGRAALAILNDLVSARGSAAVIDLCTGSGNLALALAHHQSRCRVIGSDISPDAVALARRNAQHLGLQDRVEFRVGDFLDPFAGETVDMIVCNPPYISTAQVAQMPREISGHEPDLAFDGGPFGVRFLVRLLREAPRFLKNDSWLCFEVGLGQGVTMETRALKTESLRSVRALCDHQGQIRALVAQTGSAGIGSDFSPGRPDQA